MTIVLVGAIVFVALFLLLSIMCVAAVVVLLMRRD